MLPSVPKPVSQANRQILIQPLEWNFRILDEIGIDVTDWALKLGQTIMIEAENLPLGSLAIVELHSTPELLGKATAAGDDLLNMRTVIPAQTQTGTHTIVASLTPRVVSPRWCPDRYRLSTR